MCTIKLGFCGTVKLWEKPVKEFILGFPIVLYRFPKY